MQASARAVHRDSRCTRKGAGDAHPRRRPSAQPSLPHLVQLVAGVDSGHPEAAAALHAAPHHEAVPAVPTTHTAITRTGHGSDKCGALHKNHSRTDNAAPSTHRGSKMLSAITSPAQWWGGAAELPAGGLLWQHAHQSNSRLPTHRPCLATQGIRECAAFRTSPRNLTWQHGAHHEKGDGCCPSARRRRARCRSLLLPAPKEQPTQGHVFRGWPQAPCYIATPKFAFILKFEGCSRPTTTTQHKRLHMQPAALRF